MIRTTVDGKLPDAINAAPNIEFTQIPNHILRNPILTLKAKAILCILLSNKAGWKSYKNSLSKYMKEGINLLDGALRELEECGYLVRYRYRDKKTKVIKGGFWAYSTTPNSFDLKNHIERLESMGYQIIMGGTIEKRSTSEMYTSPLFSRDGRARDGKQIPNNINNKNTNFIHIQKAENQTKFQFYPDKWEEWKQYKKEQFKFKYSPSGEKAALTKLSRLSKNNPQTADEMILQSMANGWSGLWEVKFEATQNNSRYKKDTQSNGKEISPEKIIEDRIDDSPNATKSMLGIYKALINRDLFSNRIQLNNLTKLSEALCELYDMIVAKRPKNILERTMYPEAIKSPYVIIREYVYWLEKEKWIKDITHKNFDIENTLFLRFLNSYNQEVGVDLITGQQLA